MKVRCDITGLDCPHCALELQKRLAEHEAIDDANINFPMKSLVMDVADDADEEQIVEIAQAIADDFEDGVEIELRD